MPPTDLIEAPTPLAADIVPEQHENAAAMRAAIDQMLASSVFFKAPRMCRLLQFLAERTAQGKGQELSEFAIGIAVFERNCNDYSPGNDPVVRVQVGRLREKIKAYYADAGSHSTVRISIPPGTYVPVLETADHGINECLPRYALSLLPLKCISPTAPIVSFTHGLSEELSHELFALLGERVLLEPQVRARPGATTEPVNSGATETEMTQLEGSIRVEGQHVRLALRLLNPRSRGILWSEQFDRETNLSLAAQSELASAGVNALQRYLMKTGEIALTIRTAAAAGAAKAKTRKLHIGAS